MSGMLPLIQPFINGMKSFPPPALTSGLTVFMAIIYVISLAIPSLSESWSLQSTALTNFELGRLSTFPMVHINLIHLLMNSWALVPLLRTFESINGTVRTGIVLNSEYRSLKY